MTARILVVDDILANVKLLEARLTAEYFDVITASNGPDAIDICNRGLADIVLLDVMMPGMDGREMLHRMRADARYRDLPVIMMTAVPASLPAEVEPTVEAVLRKPFGPDEASDLLRILAESGVRGLVRF